ncbi:MAG: glycosyltransferase family 4 protein [Bacteriovoracaceae bacterium]
MKLAIFVHDFTYEIGHSKAMIEYIRNFPIEIEELHLVVMKHSPLEELFPNLKASIHVHRIQGQNLRPALLKNIYFQWASGIVARSLPNDVIKIGVGTACLDVDMTNIQFIHSQWESHYFKNSRLGLLTKLYKTILFAYEKFCERRLFSKTHVKFFVIANFLKDYLIANYQVSPNNIEVAYSHANADYFSPSQKSRQEIFNELKSKYPLIQKLNLQKPICLFVGAFQRKGLQKILNQMEQSQDHFQLIAIGKNEAGQSVHVPKNIDYYEISFTRELPLFYSLADVFIFPTIYEPFGLVIIEAALMGLQVLVTREEVGASEVLNNLEGIHIFSQTDPIPLQEITMISPDVRMRWRQERLSKLGPHNWSRASQKMFELIQKS